MSKIIQQGAEAVLIKQDNKIIKRRLSKGYRIPELDEKLRKLRTRSEAKIIGKLQNKINVPKIIKVDETNKEIYMDFIPGKKLSEFLDSLSFSKQLYICKKIGEQVSVIHGLDLIHGDLTTSNMILSKNKVYFIDFGLGFHSSKIEDKAVDLHLFKQALESKHFKSWEKLMKSFLACYSPKDKSKILEQLKKVEERGRYKH